MRGSACGELACHGGEKISCHNKKGEWSYRSVSCFGSKTEKFKSGGAGAGGLCKCPDGSHHHVRDNNDNCQSLRCIGGVKIDCYRKKDSRWNNNGVKCGNDRYY